MPIKPGLMGNYELESFSMAITRIDCSFYSGDWSSGESSSYLALNPQNVPGSLVVAGSCAVRESIGSQVASKLALQHFVEGVCQYFSKEKQAAAEEKDALSADGVIELAKPTNEAALEVLEVAFRNSNSSVYEFGHRLAAGGRMAASLISLVFLNNVIAAGRVGPGSAYLCRAGEIFPFFEAPPQNESPHNQLLEAYVGSNSMVSVELASVPLAPLDVVLMFSSSLDVYQERELSAAILEVDTGFSPAGYCTLLPNHRGKYNPSRELVKNLFADPTSLSFAAMVSIGPDTIYLSDVIGESDESNY